MFKDLHEIDGMRQESVEPAALELGEYQSGDTEQFPVISAYVERLPDGLIEDEI